MKVILLKDMAKLGKRGEVKEVSDAYGINVLIKKGNGVLATPAELAKWKALEESKIRKKETTLNTFYALVEALHSVRIEIKGKKRDEKGQLFAAIRDTDIADAIFEAVKLSVDPKQIAFIKPIKSVGTHIAQIKQGEKVSDITVEVV